MLPLIQPNWEERIYRQVTEAVPEKIAGIAQGKAEVKTEINGRCPNFTRHKQR